MLPRTVSLPLLNLYKQLSRVKTKLFSAMVSGAFAEFGQNSVLTPPIRLAGEGRIAIGHRVYVGSRSWLQTLPRCSEEIGLSIGDNVSISGSCVISAALNIVIEEGVLIASNVCIVDHIHRLIDVNRPDEGITKIAPVRIGKNTWIGQNVVVLPGVTIGRDCVIGANSVVNSNIPDSCVAVGAPARIVKENR